MATEDFRLIEQQTDVNGKENIYKLLKLKNKMKVMLIHDATLSETSVALDIHIGNFSNPDDFTGLAYLCQRTLILGSEKYPEYKEFHKLVHNNGGKIILRTSSDHSTFYFNINTENDSVFEKVLDHFAQFFYKPLFECSGIEEEIRKLDSILEKTFQHHTAWYPYFERSMVETTHPYSKYDFCKKKILEKLTVKMIQSRLLSFFTEHYSANIMTLCIASCYTFDKIEKIIGRKFYEIENRKIKIPKSYEDPFKNQLCTKWHIAPNRSIRKLKLSFPLPNKKENCWQPAVDCINYFLECNHKNSLLNVLKDKSWCSSISSIGYQEARNLNFFHVVLTLSPTAYLYVDDIINLFFKYLDLFKSKYLTSQNDSLELQKILQNMFKCKTFEEEQTLTQQRIMQIVKHLHEYSMKDTLSNKYFRKFRYIASMIKIILDQYISPETIRVYVITDEMRHFSEGMSPKKWNNTGQSYIRWMINETIIHAWRNPFVTYSKLLLLNMDFWPRPNNLLFYQEFPKVIIDTSTVKLWYIPTIRKSNEIKPQSKMIFYLISPHVYENALNDILNVILANAIKAVFELEGYFPKNTQWQLINTKFGLLFEVTNYNPEQYKGFLSKIICKIFELTMKPEFETYLEISKRKFDENLTSFVKLQPMEQASFYLTNLLSEISWTHEEVLKASANVTIDEIRKFVKNFLHNMYIKGLIYGDTSIEEALQVTHHLKLHVELDVAQANIIPTISVKRTQLQPFREIKLKDDTHVLFEVENEFHDLSCIQVYYQIGKDTMDLNSKLALVRYIMSKKCLVYFEKFGDLINGTYVKMRKAGGTQGLLIVVESSMNSYAVQYHIQKFTSYLLDYICQLSKKDFEKYKTQLITCPKMPKLQDIGDALWEEAFTGLYFFDVPGTEKEYIEGIKQEELVTFYKQFVCEKRAQLSVHVLPKHKNKPKNSSEVDLKSFETHTTNSSEESSSDQSESLNESNGSLVSIDNETNMIVLKNTISKYMMEKMENRHVKKFTRYHVPEAHFEKFDDILVFKQSQDFYD